MTDGYQVNNLEPTTPLNTTTDSTSQSDLDSSLHTHSMNPSLPAPPPSLQATPSSLLMLQATPPSLQATPLDPPAANQTVAGLLTALPPVKYHYDATFTSLPFHHTMGRNVCLSSDRTLAVRLVEEYCNGYVFTQRPMVCEEALIIQVTDRFHGNVYFNGRIVQL